MNNRRKLGILIKYIPMLLLVWMIILPLYMSLTGISEEFERNLQIWTNALRLIIAVGMIENLMFQDIRGHLELGKKSPNLVIDFIEKDSKEIAVSFNEICVILFAGTLTALMSLIYMYTKIRIFSLFSLILLIPSFLGVVINMIVFYLRTSCEAQQRNLPKILNPELIPLIIELLLIFVTNKSTVGIAYECLHEMDDTIYTIIIIIVVLCYASALIFCHYSNLYCLVAVGFINKDGKRIQEKIDKVLKKNKEQEDTLRQVTQYVNEKGEKAGFLKNCKLAMYYLRCQIRYYYQSKKCQIKYIYLFVESNVVRLLSGLLEESYFKKNSIRFCEIMIVFELVILDMFLFAYLGSEAICSRFFELLSTVIIIPILLSSLTTLKFS